MSRELLSESDHGTVEAFPEASTGPKREEIYNHGDFFSETLEGITRVEIKPHNSIFTIARDDHGQWAIYSKRGTQLCFLTEDFVKIKSRDSHDLYCQVRISRGFLEVLPRRDGVRIALFPEGQANDTQARFRDHLRKTLEGHDRMRGNRMKTFFTDERITPFMAADGTFDVLRGLPQEGAAPATTVVTSVASAKIKIHATEFPPGVVAELIAESVTREEVFRLKGIAGIGFFMCRDGINPPSLYLLIKMNNRAEGTKPFLLCTII